jgi:hypothetical protein
MQVAALEPMTKEVFGLKAVAVVEEEEVRIQDLLLAIHKWLAELTQVVAVVAVPTTVLRVVQELLL